MLLCFVCILCSQSCLVSVFGEVISLNFNSSFLFESESNMAFCVYVKCILDGMNWVVLDSVIVLLFDRRGN